MLPRWFLWTLLALVCWGLWAVTAKLLGENLSAEENQAISTLGMIPVIIALLFVGDPARPHSRAGWGITLALAGGLISCLGNIGFFRLNTSGAKLTAAIPLTSLYPLVTVLAAAAVLRERLNGIQIIGIALSLPALYLFSATDDHQGELLTPFLLLALWPIVLWGVSGLLQKMATNHLSPRNATIWFLAAFIPVGIWLAISETWPKELDTRAILLSISGGFLLALGNMAILFAFASEGKAAIIAPLGGLYPLVSLPIAVFALDEKLTPRTAWGTAFAVAAVICLSLESAPKQSPKLSPESTP